MPGANACHLRMGSQPAIGVTVVMSVCTATQDGNRVIYMPNTPLLETDLLTFPSATRTQTPTNAPHTVIPPVDRPRRAGRARRKRGNMMPLHVRHNTSGQPS